MANFENPWGSPDDKGNNRSNNDQKSFQGINIDDFFNKFKDGNKMGLILLVIMILLGVWLSTGFYVINPNERGVELIFGKYIGDKDPGLRYNFPRPIGTSFKLQVTDVNKEVIGCNKDSSYDNISSYSKNRMPNQPDHCELLMLTGDENMIDVNFEVQWRISNPYDYLFHVRDYNRGFTVKSAAESAMREVIGQSSISIALDGNGRASIADSVQTLLQNILDHYKMGIVVLSVQLKKVDPPEKVIGSFRDVQSARADREREINQAYAYRNDVLPRARGDAAMILQDAEAYKQEVMNSAMGEVKRFSTVFEQYRLEPDIAKRRMYLETMAGVLKSANKTVLDKKIDVGGVLPHMSIGNMKNNVVDGR